MLPNARLLPLFTLCLTWCLVSSPVNASLLRYDLSFYTQPFAQLVFDAELGPANQNLWSSLVDWQFMFDGIVLDPTNSTPAADSRFFVDSIGRVGSTALETIVCTAPPGFPFCVPGVTVSEYPLFTGDDGTVAAFFLSLFVDGVVQVDHPDGRRLFEIGQVVIDGPATVAVSLPASSLLVALGVLGIGWGRRAAVAPVSCPVTG